MTARCSVAWKCFVVPLSATVLASQLLGVGAPAGAEEPRLKILSPAPATTVLAGSRVTVTVVGDPGVVVDTVLVVGVNQAAESSQPPFHVAFDIPLNALGPYEITAFGKNKSTGDLFQSASVNLQVETDAVLQSLHIPGGTFVHDVESMTLRVGDKEQMSLVGHFSDGVDREIPLSQVRWASRNADFLSVDSAGVATGLAPGTTEVRASALGLEGSIEVLVFAAQQE